MFGLDSLLTKLIQNFMLIVKQQNVAFGIFTFFFNLHLVASTAKQTYLVKFIHLDG